MTKLESLLSIKEPKLEELCVANNIEKIFSLLDAFNKKGKNEVSVETLAKSLAITERQIYFYVQAGTNLADLFVLKQKMVSLTPNGQYFLLSPSVLYAYIVQNLLKIPLINKFSKHSNLTKELILGELKKNDEWREKYSDASLDRRASSLKAWIKTVNDYKSNLPLYEFNISFEKKLIKTIKTV